MRQGIREKDIRDFEKYAGKLDEIMKRINQYNPEANIFVSGDEMYLFGTQDHHETGECTESVSSVYITSLDSGEYFFSGPKYH